MEQIRFDKQTKAFQLDPKRYIGRHNLAYRSAIARLADGLPVVTGKCGAICWHTANGLGIQVNNVDGSPHTQMSSGQILIESEALSKPLGSELDLAAGEGVFDFEGGQIRISGGCADPYFAVSVTVKRAAQFTIKLLMWDDCIPTDSPYFPEPHPLFCSVNPADWRAFSRLGGAGYTGIRKESPAEPIFGFCTALGTDCKNQTIENDGVITLTADRFTLYIVNPSKFESGFDIDAFFKNPLSYEDIYAKNTRFWAEFWSRRFLHFSEEGAGGSCDYIENIYYLSQYLLAGAMLAKFPMHFINGNLRSNRDDYLNWSGGYWWYNQRCLYGGMLSSGNISGFRTLLDFYYGNTERYAADTRERHPGSSGFRVPEISGWDGSCVLNDNPCTGPINDTGIQIALWFYKLWLYTAEKRDLERFLTFARGVAEYYMSAVLSDENGIYKIPAGRSNAREMYWGIESPITDLAGLRALFPLLAKHGKDKALGAKLKDVLARLAPYQTGGCPERYIAGADSDRYGPYNHDDPACELLYPLDMPYGPKDAYLLNNAFEYRHSRDQTQQNISWDNGAVWAARLFRGDDMRDCLAEKIARVQVRLNGTGTDGNCVYEMNGVVITALNESMLDCRGGVIHVFAAMPKNRRMQAIFKLCAPGGFTVYSEWAPGCGASGPGRHLSSCAKYVAIEATRGQICRLYNPWGKGRAAVVENLTTGEKTASDREIISFAAKKGGVYFIAPNGADFTCEPIEYSTTQEKKFSYNGYTCRLGN
ncbi:MAG: hypothetical protein FWE62_01895 [Firmicutes bacterium]|nr:hypothetical protein [Bacillota bacterium]